MKKVLLLSLTALFLLSCKKNDLKVKLNERKQKPNENYDKAWTFRESGHLDSAYIAFSLAKDDFTNTKDSIGIAKCLINMAEIAYLKGDYFGSQELGTLVYPYLDSTNLVDRELLSSNYNTLGNVSNGLERYEEANSFLEKAIQFTENPKSQNLYYNNIGVELMYLEKYKDAIFYFSKALKDTTSSSYAMTLSNLGKVKWLQNPSYNSAPLFFKSLLLRTQKKDYWGQNASYSHLTDYYTSSKPDSALFYANKMYDVAREIESPDDQLEALQKLVKLSSGEQSKRYFEIYRKLEDSVQTARNAAKNQFALIRYQTEKHKADNLVLQKKNTEKTYQLGIVATIALLSSAGGIVWYRKRRQKMKLESENLIQENKLKTSKKVHDVVANGLYRVMTEIENGDALDREDLLDKIDDMYQKSRDISYDKPVSTNAPVGFYERLVAMINSFRSAEVTVTQTGHTAAFWTGVAPETKHELEHVLQELLVNMDKHSSASQVELHFLRTNTVATIRYKDNGIGLPKDVHFNNGLSSTENRIQNISGTITFEKNAPSGLEILISFPCSN